jgi:hypothetical protein
MTNVMVTLAVVLPDDECRSREVGSTVWFERGWLHSVVRESGSGVAVAALPCRCLRRGLSTSSRPRVVAGISVQLVSGPAVAV